MLDHEEIRRLKRRDLLLNLAGFGTAFGLATLAGWLTFWFFTR